MIAVTVIAIRRVPDMSGTSGRNNAARKIYFKERRRLRGRDHLPISHFSPIHFLLSLNTVSDNSPKGQRWLQKSYPKRKFAAKTSHTKR
jgi:hypothetical protein